MPIESITLSTPIGGRQVYHTFPANVIRLDANFIAIDWNRTPAGHDIYVLWPFTLVHTPSYSRAGDLNTLENIRKYHTLITQTGIDWSSKSPIIPLHIAQTLTATRLSMLPDHPVLGA